METTVRRTCRVGAHGGGFCPRKGLCLRNPARRAGSAKRTQAGVAGRSARERPSRIARSGRSPGRPPKPSAREAHAHRLDRSRGQLRAGAATDVRLALPTTAPGGLAGNTRRKTTPVRGVRAPCARAAVPPGFPPPRGRCAPRKSGRASPNALSVLLRRLLGRGIAPAARRRAGCCRLVRSSVAGRRRLWPQADRRRRRGQGGAALVPFFGSFLGQARKELAVGRLPTGPPSPGRNIQNSRRSTTDNLRRSPSGKSKTAVGRLPTSPSAHWAENLKPPPGRDPANPTAR